MFLSNFHPKHTYMLTTIIIHTLHHLMPSSPLSIRSSFSFFHLHVLFLISLHLLFPPIDAASANSFKLDGKVLELDDSNFDAAVSHFDFILVDFYAPWCGHCKRLTPELEKAAPVLAGLKQPIVVAKVDADKYTKLASKHHVNGFPTLKIFMHGVATEYYGPRKADLLVRFLTKFAAPDVAALGSDSAVRDFIEAAGSDFPIFVGFGLNESVISNVAVKYKKKAWFCVVNGFSDEIKAIYDVDKVPALAVIHPTYNEHSIFYGPFEESSLEDYIKQSLLPLVLPINQDSLKSLKDDQRKVVLAILKDETEEKSKGLLKFLKAAASANRDLVFGYVGFKQWEDFAESFEVNKNTQFPKMVVWDGNVEYYLVVGSESMNGTDVSTQFSRFLKGYREGNVIQKRIRGPTLMGFISSQLGVILVFILIFVVLVVVVILSMFKEEAPTIGTRDHVDEGKSPTFQSETRELHRTVKQD